MDELLTYDNGAVSKHHQMYIVHLFVHHCTLLQFKLISLQNEINVIKLSSCS